MFKKQSGKNENSDFYTDYSSHIYSTVCMTCIVITIKTQNWKLLSVTSSKDTYQSQNEWTKNSSNSWSHRAYSQRFVAAHSIYQNVSQLRKILLLHWKTCKIKTYNTNPSHIHTCHIYSHTQDWNVTMAGSCIMIFRSSK